MFFHNLKYSLVALFKNKSLIFWTFGFPIILGTFFSMAFSDIENNEKLDIIDIAVIETEAFNNNEILQESIKILSNDKSEEQLFNTKYVDIEDAKELLEDNEITGYLLVEEELKVVVKENGINATIFKNIIDEIIGTSKIVENLVETEITNEMMQGNQVNPQLIYQNVMSTIENTTTNIDNTSSSNLSYTMIEFYTLIAMACLYGGILGMVSINNNLANMSNRGKRIEVSPTRKSILVLSSIISAYIAQIIGLFLLFIYTIFILKVDYGNNLPLIILLALVGSLAGLALGIMIATVFKVSENTKTGLLLSATMLGCFLSGMMGITMKYVIDTNIPILNKINPASMITDGFYALYYYDTLDRYYFNIASLLIFASIMIIISMFYLRRQKYDSI